MLLMDISSHKMEISVRYREFFNTLSSPPESVVTLILLESSALENLEFKFRAQKFGFWVRPI